MDAHMAGSRVRFAVTDHGPGIPEAFRPRVFEKFAQADGSDSRESGGTGLGLAIARAIVVRLGGAIGFETETGRGTTFWVEMPALETPVATPQAGKRD
jgi:signal transduction histidine kinase